MSEWIEKEEVLKQIDCWFTTGEYKYSNATHYLNKRISSIKPKESEWVSVKDEMPPEDEAVLAWNKEGFPMIDVWSGKMWGYAWTVDEISHWMPLPQKPESEDDAE
jgi:hypothetical protein